VQIRYFLGEGNLSTLTSDIVIEIPTLSTLRQESCLFSNVFKSKLTVRYASHVAASPRRSAHGAKVREVRHNLGTAHLIVAVVVRNGDQIRL
jgi:hypothetical protein